MSDLDILREMIKDEVLVPIKNSNYGKQCLVLREGRGNQKYEVQIDGIPEDIIAFKADRFPPPDKVFNGNKGENKRADFIVVAHSSKQKWIIYIEMKEGKASPKKEVVQQLKGAECVLTYCSAIGQAFWSAPGFLKVNYQQRFVSIINAGAKKRPIRLPPKSGIHDKPENMLKLNSPNRKMLQFNEIVSS